MKKQTTKTWEEVRKSARRILPVAMFAAGMMAFLPTATTYAAETGNWGPERETFTWEVPATYRTMNSIKDNPQIGDERNFVRVREYGTSDKFEDEVTAQAGKIYEVQVYFHNNASANLNKSGEGVANNVRLSVDYPERIKGGEVAVVKGTISATNTKPEKVWDTAYIYAPDNEAVYLRYVPNTAEIHSLGTINGSILSDSALYSDEGAKLGYDSRYWGILPGCNEFAGYVTFRIQVDQPGFSVNKTAAVGSSDSFEENVTVKPGDSMKFKIHFKNSGTTIQRGVIAYDNLPEGMKLVPGSVFLETPTGKGFISDDLLSKGQDIGDFYAGQEAWITYEVEIDDEEKFSCGETNLYNNSAIATDDGTKTDKVKTTVNKECKKPVVETPTELPVTGPGQIVLVMVAVVSVGVGVTYYVVSRRELKRLEQKVVKK